MKITYLYDIIFSLNGNIVSSSFESETRQLLDVDGKCYVYYKDTQVLYRIKFDTYINLLLKLNHTVETHIKYG